MLGISNHEKERLKDLIAKQLSQHAEIVFALAHGSFLTDGPFRDVDLAVYLAPGTVEPERLRWYECDLALEVTDRVKTTVDVRVLNDAPLAFKYQALKGEPWLARDGDLLEEGRARGWDEYFDFAPLARRFLQEVLIG